MKICGINPSMRDPVVKARKEYKCTLCGESIVKGELHYSSTFARGKRHISCEDGNKYTRYLKDKPCISCGHSFEICPECGKDAHTEHIRNFGTCGKCHIKALN